MQPQKLSAEEINAVASAVVSGQSRHNQLPDYPCCAKCSAFLPMKKSDPLVGWCRANPPTPFAEQAYLTNRAFPVVDGIKDWCRDGYQPNTNLPVD
jgi:hypothetical protein